MSIIKKMRIKKNKILMRKNDLFKIFENKGIANIPDKELLKKLPEDKKKKIEGLLKKYLPENIQKKLSSELGQDEFPSLEELKEEGLKKAQQEKEKKQIRGQKSAQSQKPEKKKKGQKKIQEAEGVSMTVLFVASIIPLILETIGNFTNWIGRETGISMNKDEYQKWGVVNDVKGTYENILSKGFAAYPIEGKAIYGQSISAGDNLKWANFWLKSTQTSGIQLAWFELGKHATIQLKKSGINNLDLNWETQVEKNESMKYLKTYESFLLEEGLLKSIGDGINYVGKKIGLVNKEEKKEPKDKESEIESLIGDEHGHHSHAEKFPSDYKPGKNKDQDIEFIENQIVKCKEWIENNLKTGTILGDYLIETGHELHSAYTWLIRVALQGLYWTGRLTGVKSLKWLTKARRHRIANICYCAFMLYTFGLSTVDKILHLPKNIELLGQASTAGLAGTKVGLTMLKSWKAGKNISDTLKDSFELIP